MSLFKCKKKQMKCPKCGGKMTLESGLSYTFRYKDQEVEMNDLTAMKCADCGELMFDWSEVQRIGKYVHEAASWEDVRQ